MAKDKVVVEIVAKDNTKKGIDKAEKSFKGLSSTVTKLAAAGFGIVAIKSFGEAMLDANVEAQKLNASLVSVTGSQEAASRAFKNLSDFASKTPFQLNQVVQAFIKMKSLGLDATEEALTSFGNTASAMGKDLNQMIEAVADATTGEFERLKEFGIKSKSEGDNVSFTFQGVTTTVKKNAEEITGFLRSIGDEKFGDAMSEQMKTLGGSISNLEDNWTKFLVSLGESGVADAAAASIRVLTIALNQLTEALNPTKTGRLTELQKEIESLDELIRAEEEQFNPSEAIISGLQLQVDAKVVELDALRGEVAKDKALAAEEAKALVAPKGQEDVGPDSSSFSLPSIAEFRMRDAELLAEADAAILSQQIAAGELLTDAWQQTAMNREAIDQRSADAKTALLEEEIRQAKGKEQVLGDLASLMNSESMKAFEVGKIASASQAGVKTIEAAQNSYAWASTWGGPIAGAAAAGIATIAGLSNVQKILSMKFGGGGGGAGGGGSTPNITTGGDVIGPVIQPQAQTAVTTQGAPFVVDGNSLLAVMVEEQLMPAMIEAQSRGVQLVIV